MNATPVLSGGREGARAPTEPVRPARVLYVINALGIGGAERQLVTLVNGLDRNRFRPEVAVLESGGALECEVVARDVPLRTFARRGRFSLGFFPALMRHTRAFDLVHAWLTPGSLFGLLAGRLARVPVLVGSERGSEYAHPTRLHGVLLSLEARLLRGCAGVIANSRAGGDLVCARGVARERVAIVHNALAAKWPPATRPRASTRTELGVDERAGVVLIAASLRPKKDHRTLLRAVRLLADRDVRTELLVAGEGPLRGDLERLAGELRLGARVRFLGNRDDIADLLVASDVAVLSSCEREGCPNFLMEAMALGVPVVATDAGGTGEIVQDAHTGLLVPVASPHRLADALLRLLEDPTLGDALARTAAGEAHARFDPARMVGEMEELYTKWLRRAGVPAESLVGTAEAA